MIERYYAIPNLAGIPTREERTMHLGIYAMELGISPEEAFAHLTENEVAQKHPNRYLIHLARALRYAYEEIGMVKDRKIRPRRELDRVTTTTIKRTLSSLVSAS